MLITPTTPPPAQEACYYHTATEQLVGNQLVSVVVIAPPQPLQGMANKKSTPPPTPANTQNSTHLTLHTHTIKTQGGVYMICFLIPSLLQHIVHIYIITVGSSFRLEDPDGLQNSEALVIWYSRAFVNRAHKNYGVLTYTHAHTHTQIVPTTDYWHSLQLRPLIEFTARSVHRSSWDMLFSLEDFKFRSKIASPKTFHRKNFKVGPRHT